MKKDMIQNAMSDQNADVIIDKIAITKINGMIYRDPMHECGGILLGNVSQDAVTGKYMVHVINEETDVHVNGAINIVGADLRKFKKVKVYANLCNEAGEILYILNCWKNYSVEERGYFSFSMYCSTVNRFFDIEDLEYAEIYVVFNEKDGK